MTPRTTPSAAPPMGGGANPFASMMQSMMGNPEMMANMGGEGQGGAGGNPMAAMMNNPNIMQMAQG